MYPDSCIKQQTLIAQCVELVDEHDGANQALQLLWCGAVRERHVHSASIHHGRVQAEHTAMEASRSVVGVLVVA